MKIALKNVNYASAIKPARGKWTGLAFSLLACFLLLCLIISPAAAAAVNWKISPSNPTVGDTLKITGKTSPGASINAEVSFEKVVPVSGNKYQYSLDKIEIPDGINNRFTVRAEGVKDLHIGVKKLLWFNMQTDASKRGVATISQANVPPWTYNVRIDGNALSKKGTVNLKMTASQTLKADKKGNFEYSYPTSSMPEGKFRVKIGDSEKTVYLKPRHITKPVARFLADPISGNVPLTVQFTDKSTGTPTFWQWNFGDKSKYAYDQNPVHTYTKPGKYTVTLTVKNAAGTNTRKIYITVKPAPKPVAAFTANPTSGNMPLYVQFTDKSANQPTYWQWNFGDRSRYSYDQNPVHEYTKAGKYRVTLLVKNAAGASVKSAYITAGPTLKKPVAAFGANKRVGKTPFRVQFIDKSANQPTSWEWSFGDRTYSTAKNPAHTYAKAGIYKVTLTVKNKAGTSTKTVSRYIVVFRGR